MCGRYRLTAKERYLRDHFGVDADLTWAPRWNIAPTQPVPVVRQDAKETKRTFTLLRWGLIPYWTLLAKYHMTCRPSCAKAEVRVGAGRTPLQ
jgi:putative SOS response-associated peptidase YedK